MTRPILEARALSVTLHGDVGPVRILDGARLDVGASEIVDVVGPSGVGKTTLLRALARLLPHTEGELTLHGRPAAEFAPQEWRTHVALLPQRPVMWPGTVAENLMLPHLLRVRADAARPSESELRSAMGDVGLTDVAPDRDAARLSVGQAARIALLRVLLAEPTVLLLDEPDASLDDASAEQVAAMTERFAEAGGAVVRVRHVRSGGAARVLRMSGGVLEEVTSGGR